MTEQLSSWHPTDLSKRGIPTRSLIRAYECWAKGEIGVILTGNFMIFPDHLESVGDPVIPPDAPFHGERFEAFKAMAAAGKSQGSIVLPQVSHPGRLSNEYFQKSPVSASAVNVTQVDKKPVHFADPHEATHEEIRTIIDAFAHAAEYIEKAGFDGMEVHGAHGFFLSSFLNVRTNIRTDQYGGSIQNRMRIYEELEVAIRKRVSRTFILGIKINSVEFQESDLSVEDAAKVCRMLEAHRFDFVELSGGSSENTMTGAEHEGEPVRESTMKREAYFLEFAEKIVPGLTKTKTYVTGGLRTVGGMVRALETVDGIGLGRPLILEFDLCKRLLAGEITGCIVQYMAMNEFWLSLMCGNRNIREVGLGNEPLELWDPEVMAELREYYEIWVVNKSTDREYRGNYGVDSTEEMKDIDKNEPVHERRLIPHTVDGYRQPKLSLLF
ncbi:hypothetical protein CLAIMM_11478 [Cladophialophora immunda]|nr:hypothetical protein CLAIMM_11478 [Cladophialophora immunda]